MFFSLDVVAAAFRRRSFRRPGGSGGNCYYEDDTVYYEGELVTTTEEYADQAMGFAEAGTETLDEAVASNADIEWMPLGVFALVHEENGNPTFFHAAAAFQGWYDFGNVYQLGEEHDANDSGLGRQGVATGGLDGWRELEHGHRSRAL